MGRADAADRARRGGLGGRGAAGGRQVVRRLSDPPDGVRRSRRRLPRRRRRAGVGLRRPDREPRARARARARVRGWRARAAGGLPPLPRPGLRERARRSGPGCPPLRRGRPGHGVHARGPAGRADLHPVLALLPRLEQHLGGLGPHLARRAPCSGSAGSLLRGTTAYPGFHQDDWEGYQVRIDADGRAWARATSHGHYQGCKQRLCHNRWIGPTGWTRVSRGSHAGHIPVRLEWPRRRRPDRVRPAPSPGFVPLLPGGELHERTSSAEALRLVPLESRRPGGYRPQDSRRHASLEEGGVPGTRERQVVNARPPTGPTRLRGQ